MKHRITALGLALCLTAALAACGGADGGVQPTPDPSDVVTASPEGTQAPSATPIPDKGTPPADVTDVPVTSAPESGAPTAAPTPVAIGDPTAPPSEAPAKAPSAAEVYAAVSSAAGVSYDNSSNYAENFYTTLNTGDVEDYVLYMPAMSAQIEEIFIARVKSGRMDAVKSACRDRQQGMAEEAAFYGTNGAYVDSYQLVSQGDWVLFCVCEKTSSAVEAFKGAVK